MIESWSLECDGSDCGCWECRGVPFVQRINGEGHADARLWRRGERAPIIATAYMDGIELNNVIALHSFRTADGDVGEGWALVYRVRYEDAARPAVRHVCATCGVAACSDIMWGKMSWGYTKPSLARRVGEVVTLPERQLHRRRSR